VEEKGPKLPTDPLWECLGLDVVEAMSVRPDELVEEIRSGVGLQDGESFAGDALASEAGGSRIAILRNAAALAVCAAAIGAEDQFILVAAEEAGGKAGVAGEGVVAGVGGEIAVEVGIVGEPLVGDTAALDGPAG